MPIIRELEHLKHEAQVFCTRVYRLATALDAEGFQARAAVAREKYPHFDAVVFNPDLSITEPMRDRITASDRGPEIAYYLGLHPEEAPLKQIKQSVSPQETSAVAFM